MIRQVACPQCGKPALFSPDNPFRPFCGERCKLIDMGAWASEAYRISAPAEESPESDGHSAPPIGSAS